MASRRLGSSLTVTLWSLLITVWPLSPRMLSIFSFMSTRHSRPVSGLMATGQGRFLSRCTRPIFSLGTSSNLNLPQGPSVMDVMVTESDLLMLSTQTVSHCLCRHSPDTSKSTRKLVSSVVSYGGTRGRHVVSRSKKMKIINISVPIVESAKNFKNHPHNDFGLFNYSMQWSHCFVIPKEAELVMGQQMKLK